MYYSRCTRVYLSVCIGQRPSDLGDLRETETEEGLSSNELENGQGKQNKLFLQLKKLLETLWGQLH